MNQSYWDIHNHILPGVDDGSSCMEESMDMIREEYKQGVRNLILTPHNRPGMFHISGEQRMALFHSLKEQSLNELPDMQLYLGCEIYYNQNILMQLTMPYNRIDGRDIALVEFPTDMPFPEIVKRVKKIRDLEWKLIIAHVERYDGVVKHPESIKELKNLGCLIQVNAETFLKHGFAHGRFLNKLIKEKLVDCLASDAHDMKFRKVNLQSARNVIEKKYGKDAVEQLFKTNVENYLGIKNN